MKKKNLKAGEVKLQPVSSEEVLQILNENPLAAAYGCGSGCGGCGCGDDGEPYDTPRVSGTVTGEDNYSKYGCEFRARATVEYTAHIHYGGKYDPRADIVRDKVEVSITLFGSSNTARDEDGKEVTYIAYVEEAGPFHPTVEPYTAASDGRATCVKGKSGTSEDVRVIATADFELSDSGNNVLIPHISVNLSVI